MESEWYDQLQKNGKIGTRHSLRDGSKINIYDLSTLEYIDSSSAETLEFYRDHKDELLDNPSKKKIMKKRLSQK